MFPVAAMTWIEPVDGDVVLSVRVQPRASRNEVVGMHGDALKIRLTAPPVDGAANQALVKFVAKRLGCGRSAVAIEHGFSGRLKQLRIRDMGVDEASRALLAGRG